MQRVDDKLEYLDIICAGWQPAKLNVAFRQINMRRGDKLGYRETCNQCIILELTPTGYDADRTSLACNMCLKRVCSRTEANRKNCTSSSGHLARKTTM